MSYPSATETVLATLLSFDTTSRNSNLELIDWVAQALGALGMTVRLTHDDSGTKANLFARMGPPHLPAIVLSGHSDVVPVDGQSWSSNPFELTLKDDKLYGRGTADMKGFIASVLASFQRWHAAGLSSRLPLALALSYDEEVGCLGVSRLIADIHASGVNIAGCIIGEPTAMQTVVAHKGIAHWRCRVQGRAAHSSLTPQGVNAIEYAARLVGFVTTLAEAEQAQGRRKALFDVPFNTLQTGWIQGGSAPNIVPRDCEFIIECRWLPGDDPERFIRELEAEAQKLLHRMRQVAPEAQITIEPIVHCPSFECEDDNPVQHWLQQLGGGQGKAVAYTTEAGHFARAGIPAVVCGPGAIEQAHRPDEFITRAQLAACDAWLESLAQALLANEGRLP
ncbi:acetylornithine deacetylase [Craterilacuibacter sp.]|uniref:acetylornithine deacetylase n=1 Tax=Craterilacuibacter sp. TaxID=2870909 RepID=UPI003F3F7E64